MNIQKIGNTMFAARVPKISKLPKSKYAIGVGVAPVGFFTASTLGTDLIVTPKAREDMFGSAKIKSVKVDKDDIKITTDRGHIFKCVDAFSNSDLASRAIVKSEFKGESVKYGIPSYIDTVDSIRRLDILKKGLNISDVLLNEIPDKNLKPAIRSLSRSVRHRVNVEDLYSVGSKIFYFDAKNDTVYDVYVSGNYVKKNDEGKCKFLRDEEGHVIGFERTGYDVYTGVVNKKTYIEQQSPSYKLPAVVRTQDSMDFAQACRFGNVDYKGKLNIDTEKLLNKLINGGIKNPSVKNISAVRYQKGEESVVFLTYYNKNNGCSIVFNRDYECIGKIAYERNSDGEFVNYYYLD